jgi:hypothetical protein
MAALMEKTPIALVSVCLTSWTLAGKVLRERTAWSIFYLPQWIHPDVVGRLTPSKNGQQEIHKIHNKDE